MWRPDSPKKQQVRSRQRPVSCRSRLCGAATAHTKQQHPQPTCGAAALLNPWPALLVCLLPPHLNSDCEGHVRAAHRQLQGWILDHQKKPSTSCSCVSGPPSFLQQPEDIPNVVRLRARLAASSSLPPSSFIHGHCRSCNHGNSQ